MSWWPWLEDGVLRQMRGLPPEAFDMLVRTLARICDDPYDPVHSTPAPPVLGRRVADLGDVGFIEFIADEDASLIRSSTWSGQADQEPSPRALQPCPAKKDIVGFAHAACTSRANR